MFGGLLGGCLWALDTVILSIAMRPFALEWSAPLVATGLHDLFSALWMSGFVSLRKKWKSIRQAYQTHSGRMVILAALLGGPVGMSGYVFSVQYLGAGLSAAISSFYPALAALIGALVFKEKLSRSQIAGMALSLACIVLMSWPNDSGGSNFILGLVMALCCMSGWALEGVIVQHSMKEDLDNEICLFLRQTTSAAVFVFLIIPLLSSWRFALQAAHSCGLLIAAAAFCGTASYLLYYGAIGRLGASRAMPLNSTYCAWAVFFSFVLEGIVPSLWQIILCFGIIGGAVLCARQPEGGH